MRFRNVSPRGELRSSRHGFLPFKAEFDVLAEHVEGIVHQAYGVDPNFEPVDDEAKKAVTDAQAASAAPTVSKVELETAPGVFTDITKDVTLPSPASLAPPVPAPADTTTEESK